jgi:hypothetical protein
VIIPVFLLFILFSCDDIITKAVNEKIGADDESIADDPVYEYSVYNFAAQKGNNNREVLLTWINPVDEDFDDVLLLRDDTTLPTGPDDSDAEIIYTGTNSRFRDKNRIPDTTYYYAIYTRDVNGIYSAGSFGSIAITETIQDIRDRSFFIAGGSSSKSDPTGNLVAGVDMFDPLTDTLYADVTTLPTPRVFCDITSVEGKIYVIAGKNGSGVLATVDILDISDFTWTTGTDMPAAKCALRTVTWDEKIYCLGGSTTTTPSGTSSVEGENTYIYDPSIDTWDQGETVFSDINLAGNGRAAFSAIAFKGCVYYFGGVEDDGTYETTGICHNILTNQEIACNGLLGYIGATSSLYYKELDNGNEMGIFFTIGGSSDNDEDDLPASNMILTTNYVYAAFLPNVTGGAPVGYRVYPQDGPNTGIENFTNRMYAGCEYFGDYVYYFGGITADNQASTIIEKLDVQDGALTAGEWSILSTTLLTSRYGFGITRVNK